MGQRGEALAARYLKTRGYKILYRNFSAPHGGEVDIVCRDRRASTLAFVEVKTRRDVEFGVPASAVNETKQRLIARGAMAWLKMLGNPQLLFRFDIVEVILEEEQVSFHLIQGAFELPEPLVY